MGRNNPHYHYTGAEDTLEFVIDWFSADNNRTDVIFNCRWVEALSKNNGYNNRLPRVKIKWGELDYLFGEHEWVVSNAPYKLSNFVAAYHERDENFKAGELVKVGSLPQQAYQTITLKRITKTNLTSKQIRGNVGYNRA